MSKKERVGTRGVRERGGCEGYDTVIVFEQVQMEEEDDSMFALGGRESTEEERK